MGMLLEDVRPPEQLPDLMAEQGLRQNRPVVVVVRVKLAGVLIRVAQGAVVFVSMIRRFSMREEGQEETISLQVHPAAQAAAVRVDGHLGQLQRER
jgi:hypothetical protein